MDFQTEKKERTNSTTKSTTNSTTKSTTNSTTKSTTNSTKEMTVNIDWSPYRENVSVLGANQEGKTDFIKEIAKTLVTSGFNVIVLDPHGRFVDIDTFCVKRNLFDIKKSGFEVLFPHQTSKEFFFKQFCPFVYSLKNVVVIIDELHNFVEKQPSKAIESFSLLAHNCNNRSIGLICIFHAPSEVPSFVLRVSNIKFMFYMDLPTDIDYCAKWIDPMVRGFLDGSIAKYRKIYKKRHEEAVII